MWIVKSFIYNLSKVEEVFDQYIMKAVDVFLQNLLLCGKSKAFFAKAIKTSISGFKLTKFSFQWEIIRNPLNQPFQIKINKTAELIGGTYGKGLIWTEKIRKMKGGHRPGLNYLIPAASGGVLTRGDDGK